MVEQYFTVIDAWWEQELDPLKLKNVDRTAFERFLIGKGIISHERELHRVYQAYCSKEVVSLVLPETIKQS